ncbi:MAG: TolC family protein [Betaproteobacteria bacterium]
MSSLSKTPASRQRLVYDRFVYAATVLLVIALLACTATRAEEPRPLSLKDALRIASAQSSQLSAQRYAISAVQQATVSARQLPDPKAVFGVDNLPVTGADSLSLTRDFMTMRKIGVMQDFPRAVKRELKGKLAERIVDRETAMLVDVEAALRRDVATAWVDRYFAEQMGRLVDEQMAEVGIQIDALKAGLKTGKTQPADFLTVQVNLQTLLDRRAEFDKQGARAKAMLSRWLGDAAGWPQAQFSAAVMTLTQGSLSEHSAHHPHVQSLERQIDVAQAEAYLAQAATKPDWSLELAYQQRGPNFSNMISLQVSIDLPLFQRNRQGRDIAAKLAQLAQARDIKEDAVRQHLAEAQAAWSDWETATARLKRFDESLLPLSRERTQATLATYRGGRGDITPVLQARRDELDLKLQTLQLSQDQGRAYAQLLYFLPPEVTQ